ncbi:hypothetical protein EJB05_30783, partial [Eragrostis curvula]
MGLRPVPQLAAHGHTARIWKHQPSTTAATINRPPVSCRRLFLLLLPFHFATRRRLAFGVAKILELPVPSSPRQKTMSRRNSRTIYVGNLPGDIREREVEDLFYKYGRILDIDLKIPPRPPGYAFVEFEDPRDADDAIYGRDGYNFDGYRLRVELAHGGRGQSYSYDRPSSYSSGRHAGVSRRSDYRVMVTGLPSSASWQDLKDHMRRAGDVCFSDVYREAGETIGIVDYTNYDDMKYAIRKLDDSQFRNAFSRAYIRVREYDARSRSRSRSRSYSRSPSYSRSMTPKSVSRSPSPVDESLLEEDLRAEALAGAEAYPVLDLLSLHTLESGHTVLPSRQLPAD